MPQPDDQPHAYDPAPGIDECKVCFGYKDDALHREEQPRRRRARKAGAAVEEAGNPSE